jgi:DNA polymerase III subunit epsilon
MTTTKTHMLRRDAIIAAKTWMANPDDFVIVDTETTGLGDSDEIIEIAIINMRGMVLLDTLVKPIRKTIPKAASDIHGIKIGMLENAPTWARVFPQVKRILRNRKMITYNLAYDARLMAQSCKKSKIAFDLSGQHWCAMLAYASYVGEWNEAKGDFKWQKLPSAGHRAIHDCRATLQIIEEMAATPLEIERKTYKISAWDRIPTWQKTVLIVAVVCLLMALLGSLQR